MIQGAINQLLAIGAAVKTAGDIADAKAVRGQKKIARQEESNARMADKAKQAKERSMQRMKDAVKSKWDQNEEFQIFKATLGKDNQAPDLLKQIAFEAQKNQPEVRVGKEKVDIFSLGPEAQEAIRRAK